MSEEQDFNYVNVFVFLGLSALFYLATQDMGYLQIKHGFFWPCVVGALIISGQTIIWWSRYGMPKVVLNGFNGSIWGRPVPVRDNKGKLWAVFNTGVFKEPVHGKGKLATVIVPWNQLKKSGMNYHGSTLVQKKPFKLLPTFLFNYLRYNKENFNINKIYFGFVDEKFSHENPKFEDVQAEIESLNSLINSQRLKIEGSNDELIEQVELMKKVSQPTFLERLRRNPQADQGVHE